MHENTQHKDPYAGWYWWHIWKNGDAAVVRNYVSKYRAWRPTQQRARDGTVVRHRTGGLKRVS